MKTSGMKKLELRLIECPLLRVVISIQTSSCGFVRLKMQEVIPDNSWT